MFVRPVLHHHTLRTLLMTGTTTTTTTNMTSHRTSPIILYDIRLYSVDRPVLWSYVLQSEAGNVRQLHNTGSTVWDSVMVSQGLFRYPDHLGTSWVLAGQSYQWLTDPLTLWPGLTWSWTDPSERRFLYKRVVEDRAQSHHCIQSTQKLWTPNLWVSQISDQFTRS